MRSEYINDSPNASGDDKSDLLKSPIDALGKGTIKSNDADDNLIVSSPNITRQSRNLNLTLDTESCKTPLSKVALFDHFFSIAIAESDDSVTVGLLSLDTGLDFAKMIARLMNWNYNDDLLALLNPPK